MTFLWAFLIGGALCVTAQILIDLTDMTPCHVLVSYVVLGVILGAVGIYEPISEFAGSGVTVPITGFGYALSKGVEKAVASDGLFGALSGGLSATAPGIALAICLALLLSLIFKPKSK